MMMENPSTITDTKTSLGNSCTWLVAYCVGKDRSIKFAAEEGKKDGLLPLAGAAALLKGNTNDSMQIPKVLQLNGSKVKLSVFYRCLFPLGYRFMLTVRSPFAQIVMESGRKQLQRITWNRDGTTAFYKTQYLRHISNYFLKWWICRKMVPYYSLIGSSMICGRV